jgi:PPM family protein phosphatase
MKQIDVRSAGMTDTGLMRTDNQDQFFVADLTRSMLVQCGSLAVESNSRLFGGPLGRLFLVADGMGGHRAGSEASKLAIQYFVTAILNSMRWLVRIEPPSEASFTEDLKTMLACAHRELQNQSREEATFQGMGTTLTMAYVAWPRMFVVHAGDTRCYVLRDQQLRLVTRDHTVANQMMEAGQLAPESLERSPWSNVLVNALGAGASEVFADIYKLDLHAGDTLLLCSDGLNKHVDDAAIRSVLLKMDSVEQACHDLVGLAKKGGGSDNITVVIAHFFEVDHQIARMQIIASRPAEERILKDLALPEEEIDTNADEGSDEPSTVPYPG